jgi:hypothetical protein
MYQQRGAEGPCLEGQVGGMVILLYLIYINPAARVFKKYATADVAETC